MKQTIAFLQINLGASYYISVVAVQFRLDCCHNLNTHVELRIGDHDANIYGSNPNTWAGDTGPNVDLDKTMFNVGF